MTIASSIYVDSVINAGAVILIFLTAYLFLVPGTQDFRKIAISLLLFIIFNFTGDLINSYYLYALNQEPTISASIIFWTLGYLPLLYITYYTVWKNHEHIKIRWLMFIFIFWILLLCTAVLPAIILSFIESTSMNETILLSLAPILDMILLFSLSLILIMYREGFVLRYWIFITAGIVSFIIGDLLFVLYPNPDPDEYYQNMLPNVFYISAYLIMALGIYLMVQMRHQFQSIEPKGRYEVSQVFVAHKGGTLLAHALTREANKCVDADVMVAMLTAVQDFVKESFRGDKNERLDELKFGNQRLIFKRGGDFMLVVVISGQVTDTVQTAMKRALDQVEEKYGTVIKTWDGTVAKVAGIKDIIEGLLTNN